MAPAPDQGESRPELHILPDADTAAQKAAAFIGRLANEAVQERDRFVLAVSGGQTPSQMFRRLTAETLPWVKVHLVQVDERIAAGGSADRNFTGLKQALVSQVPLPSAQVHPMPVQAQNLVAAMRDYAEGLRQFAGSPPVLDLVHLGLGNDGHTASLVPGDPVLDVQDSDVAVTGVYEGHRRMTLTYPIINRARRTLWLVTGGSKARVLARLYAGDVNIPAGWVRRERAVIFADQAAAAMLP